MRDDKSSSKSLFYGISYDIIVTFSRIQDRIDFSRGIRIQYQVREQATPSTSHGITATALAKAFCGQKPTPTLPSFIFQSDFSSMRLWFIDLIQASDCRARITPNSPCVAKIYAERITIPPDDINATLSQNPTIVSDDLQADFQWIIDALLMLWPSEKRRIKGFWATYYH